MTEVVGAGEEMVEVVEAEKGEEGGGSSPGAVVDIEVVGPARDHNFKMRMGISQWMIWNGTTKAAKFDSKVEKLSWNCYIYIYFVLFLVDLIHLDHLPVGQERALVEGLCLTGWEDPLEELLLV